MVMAQAPGLLSLSVSFLSTCFALKFSACCCVVYRSPVQIASTPRPVSFGMKFSPFGFIGFLEVYTHTQTCGAGRLPVACVHVSWGLFTMYVLSSLSYAAAVRYQDIVHVCENQEGQLPSFSL